ncbi:MAG: class I SAM-dependent RNA methyltransferase, partial [Alphaproteobacteria bacterium]
MAQRQIEVTIESLGAQGDGIAQTADGPVYVPQTAPGDRLLVSLRKRRGDGFAAEVIERLADGPDRVTPPCPHFSQCGGCAAQHLADPLYAAWKHGLVTTALSRRGLDSGVVAPLRATKADGRRRAHLTAIHTSRGLHLGYHQRRSDAVLNIEDCLILRPALRRLLAPLRLLLTTALPRHAEAKLLLTQARNGIDLLITTRHEFDVDARMAWAVFAHDHRIARIEWRPDSRAEAEPMAVLEAPLVSFAGVDVPIPTGGFLQASAEAESIMVEILLGAIGKAKTMRV